MKFTSTQDIRAPVEAVFAELTDYPAFERQALRRGVEIQRRSEAKDATSPHRIDWEAVFPFRGRNRRLELSVTEPSPPGGIATAGRVQGLSFTANVTLTPLSPGRTRLTLVTHLSARSLGARLVLQSLRLVRGRAVKRLDQRLATFVRDIESRHARASAAV